MRCDGLMSREVMSREVMSRLIHYDTYVAPSLSDTYVALGEGKGVKDRLPIFFPRT